MKTRGLSPEQLALRRNYICGSDADLIMQGRWRDLWMVKTGREPEPDLSGVFEAQLGLVTEALNLEWLEKTTGRAVTRRAEWVVSDDSLYPWMACNIDGVTTTKDGDLCLVDAKHVGSFNEQTILRYTAQLTHNATVVGADWWMLSVIAGNKWIGPNLQPVDPLYQSELLLKERAFWSYVEADREPRDTTPTKAPKPQAQLRKIWVPTYDDAIGLRDKLLRENNWLGDALGEARAFLDTEGAHKAHMAARESLKKLVPEDVGELSYGRFTLKRDRRGVTMTAEAMETDDA